jgi:cold shock CspA family protein
MARMSRQVAAPPDQAMRFDGTLSQWNADRGLGQIRPDQGGQELPVNISAFPRDRRLCALGDPLSFEVEPDRSGAKCAVRILRRDLVSQPTGSAARSHRSPASRAAGSSGFGKGLVLVIMVAAMGWYGYGHYNRRVAQIQAGPQSSLIAPVSAPVVAGFQCDGRKYCSQMTSCWEAKQFLKNCPGVQMDGDHDGVPCESQWCTGPFGN